MNRFRRSLQALGRSWYRLRQRLRATSVGEALAIYRRDGRPLGAVDAWRLTRLQRTNGRNGLVRIRPRVLGGAEVFLRRGTSDASVATQTFVHRLHVPPGVIGSPQVVWDVGSNIGLTVADYACLYPHARIVGVEPSADNVQLARRNVEPWHDRCTLIECAVWPEDGEVAFELQAGQELAGRIVESSSQRVRACSLTTLLRDEPSVDLLKLDIEGAEQPVLSRNTEWAAKIRNIIVEVHEPYTVDACVADLERLGFRTSINPAFWVSVVGTK